ncbi:MAG: energy-coupling factor ABC transporter permease [Opitutaceae bacterium]
MHLIQGTLDTTTTLMTSAAGLFALAGACYGVRNQVRLDQVPALLCMSVFVFLAQMVDVATGFGFSSHLIGAALLAILFSPCAAMLAMAAILTLQVAVLGDGAWNTLGANFLVMGAVAPFAGYTVYRFMQGRRGPQVDAGQLIAVTIASIVSVFAASSTIALLVGSAVLPMVSMAAVWGVFEAVISVALFSLCVRRQALLNVSGIAFKPILAACIVALCVAPFSSRQADGVEVMVESSAEALR